MGILFKLSPRGACNKKATLFDVCQYGVKESKENSLCLSEM